MAQGRQIHLLFVIGNPVELVTPEMWGLPSGW
jgi:hypothetical protein